VENRLHDKISLSPIQFNIRSLRTSCSLIADLKSEIGPALCDKRCFARAVGLGMGLGESLVTFVSNAVDFRCIIIHVINEEHPTLVVVVT